MSGGKAARLELRKPPPVAVIIASELGEEYLRPCLESLLPQACRQGAQVIVVQAGDPDGHGWLREAFPQVQILVAPGKASIPEMRFAGLGEVLAEVVAWTEGAALFAPGWLEQVLKSHQAGLEAVGGAIDPAPDFDRVSWAAHVCEYGPFMTPLREGEQPGPCGFNASYTIALLERCTESVCGRHWENILNEEVLKRGARLGTNPRMRVINMRRYRWADFLRQRGVYGRGYGRVRSRRISLPAHLSLLLLTAGLPILMLWRYGRCMLAKRLSLKRSLVAFPLLVLFSLGWSLGEWWGYLLGLLDRAMGRR
ncbi:MAG: glycosyltransferase [Acidobacteriota bacterium]